MGGGGARPRPCRRPPDPALDRLLRLPLVPRDGARVVRGRGDGRADEPALREREGRPRGASRPRCGLHERRRRHDRARRLADDRLSDPGRRAVPRRHLLPAAAAAGDAVVPAGDARGRPGVAGAAQRGRPRGPQRARRAAGGRRRAAVRRAPLGGGAGGGGARAAPGLRPGVGRLRRGAQVPAGGDDRLPAADACPHRGRRGPAYGVRHARRHGARRDVRPGRRRLPPLLGGRLLARPPLREDALRQRAAGHGVPRGARRDGRRALCPRGRRDARVHAARAAPARGRIRLGPRCRHGWRGGRDLRVDAGPARGGAGSRAGACGRGLLRRHRGGQLRGRRHHPAGAGRPARRPRGTPPGAARAPVAAAAAGPRRQGDREPGTGSRWPRSPRADGGCAGPICSTPPATAPGSCSAR